MTSTLGDVVIVGGGIAGVSAAYFLAEGGQCDRITLVEAEAQLAHHTTGRSAALFTENFGSGPVRPLGTASLGFFENPPADLVDTPLMHERGVMTVATKETDHDELDRQLATGRAAVHPVIEIDVAEAAELAPHIRFGDAHRVMWEPRAFDIDVAALHQAFVRGFTRLGGQIRTTTRLDSARRHGDRWRASTTQGDVDADLLVNAAGAWGDEVARSAGVAPLGLQPLKRTAFMVTSPFPGSDKFAFVADVHHDWYLRPDGTQFMCSPADEQPSEPCDARADEIDIARTIDVLNQHTLLGIRSVNSHWAGLRTFSPDRSMVLGPDPADPSFFWCVGQGGTGIQTSPGAGRLVADLASNGVPGDHFDDCGLDLAQLSPIRFR